MTVLLVRHGRSTSNTAGTLAGRTPGVGLDEKGVEQAQGLVERLASIAELTAVVRSPLQRCAETVAPLLAARGLPDIVDDRLIEVDYGDWSGREIKDLLKEPLWTTVQRQPSAAVFPGGEGLAQVQARAVAAIRELDAIHGAGGRMWVACTHGDVIKSVLADALCTHLDGFQRIVADPASISVVRYAPDRPYVHGVNCAALPAIPSKPPETVGGSRG